MIGREPGVRDKRYVGHDAELFILDARNGSLRENYLTWLGGAVEESTRTWKVGKGR